MIPFETAHCVACRTELAFDPDSQTFIAVPVEGARCANAPLVGCNWVAPAGGLCRSCALTRTRPADADGLAGLAVVEAAKRRLLFELDELGLAVVARSDAEPGGLAFDLLSSASGPVTTGHADGVITLDLAEADAAQREQRRAQLREHYRTVLGTLRHEIGHYYQPLLAPDPSPERDACRELFGDDRADYQAALDDYYASGPPNDWPERFVSAYATMHPYEDWAETFAHYLHIRDTLQTAAAYGVRVHGPSLPTSDPVPLYSDPLERDDPRSMFEAWLPLTYALNALNRSMGAEDLYPFVIPPPAVRKLRFVHDLCVGSAVGS